MSIEEIKSPCIGVCQMNEETGQCLGCFRTIDEIREWWNMTDGERDSVMKTLDQRQEAAFE